MIGRLEIIEPSNIIHINLMVSHTVNNLTCLLVYKIRIPAGTLILSKGITLLWHLVQPMPALLGDLLP
jgi:uncharacterized membrane protein AbrB (regulator of aidB expression)